MYRGYSRAELLELYNIDPADFADRTGELCGSCEYFDAGERDSRDCPGYPASCEEEYEQTDNPDGVSQREIEKAWKENECRKYKEKNHRYARGWA